MTSDFSQETLLHLVTVSKLSLSFVGVWWLGGVGGGGSMEVRFLEKWSHIRIANNCQM